MQAFGNHLRKEVIFGIIEDYILVFSVNYLRSFKLKRQ